MIAETSAASVKHSGGSSLAFSVNSLFRIYRLR
jgi:hypothetical protein